MCSYCGHGRTLDRLVIWADNIGSYGHNHVNKGHRETTGCAEEFQLPFLIVEGISMKAIVDAELCTACGLCEDACPEVFEVMDDVAKVKLDPVPPECEDSCREAVESCPVEAISLSD